MTNEMKVTIRLRVTEDQEKRYKALAASENLGLSEWIRRRCEEHTQPPVASQGHVRVESGAAKNEKPKSVPVAPVAVVGASPTRKPDSTGTCSRTGFPESVCLCPPCKAKKGRQ